jgi:hypothetical protein
MGLQKNERNQGLSHEIMTEKRMAIIPKSIDLTAVKYTRLLTTSCTRHQHMGTLGKGGSRISRDKPSVMYATTLCQYLDFKYINYQGAGFISHKKKPIELLRYGTHDFWGSVH